MVASQGSILEILSAVRRYNGRAVERAGDVTKLLREWSEGDQRAFEQLVPLVYRELYRMARRYMARERPGHTLQTSALVNEAYLKLIDNRRARWQSRAQFFAIAAQLMRRILVDFARQRRYLKRGGGAPVVELQEEFVSAGHRSNDLVAIDDALKALEAAHSRKARVVELRFFGGLSVEETAEVLKVSPETVMRDWKLAKAWLQRELNRNAKG
jgi:RNA polymerase sigma-70 factor, ECF subfamily